MLRHNTACVIGGPTKRVRCSPIIFYTYLLGDLFGKGMNPSPPPQLCVKGTRLSSFGGQPVLEKEKLEFKNIEKTTKNIPLSLPKMYGIIKETMASYIQLHPERTWHFMFLHT